MKKIYILCVAFALTWLCSCAKESDHDKERGLALGIQTSTPFDPVSQVTVWLFSKTDSLLRYEHEFTKFRDLASTLLPVPFGEYDVIVVTNATPSFEHNARIGVTKSEELLLNIKNASSSPNHLHYGNARVEVSPSRITPLNLIVKRVLAQIDLTIKSLDSNVACVSAEILNSSEGFYPATDKLSQNSTIVNLGEVTLLNGNSEVAFPTFRLMPVISSVGLFNYAKTGIKTLMRLTFTYKTGVTLSFQIEMPQMQSAGEYRVEIVATDLRPGIPLQITDINGWSESTPLEGDILNPNK